MKIVRLILRIFLILITIVVVYPFVWSIFSSFKTNEEFLASPFSLPSGFYLDNFVRAFQKSNIAGNFLSSIIVLVCTLFLVVLFTVPASYVLSRYRFAGRRLIKSFFMAGTDFRSGLADHDTAFLADEFNAPLEQQDCSFIRVCGYAVSVFDFPVIRLYGKHSQII